MGIFALGLAFDTSQTVRPTPITLRGHQLHDLCGHDKIGVLVVEYDGKYCQGQDCQDPAAMSQNGLDSIALNMLSRRSHQLT